MGVRFWVLVFGFTQHLNPNTQHPLFASMPVIKESSDALTPPVVTHAYVERAPRRRRPRDYFALAVATCGVGFAPVAPGTWGSAVGVAIYLLVERASFGVFAYARAGGMQAPPLEALSTT